MCGLIAQIKKKDDGIPTHDTIKGMLASQINRGTEGFGYIAFDDVVSSYVRRENRYQIEAVMDKNKARSMIFHHRIPTSTPNFADCTHPIKVSHDELTHDYYLVHNGMISNYSLLHAEHIQLGYEYITTIESTIKTKNDSVTSVKYNDSEALAIDVARYLEGKQDRIKSSGSIAFIIAQCDKVSGKVNKIYFGRNSSPLTMNITQNSVVLRSEGEEDMCSTNTLYCLDMESFTITSKYCPIGELMSVRNDMSQGYGSNYKYGGVTNTSREYNGYDTDFDDDLDTPVGHRVYNGGTVTKILNTVATCKMIHHNLDEEIESDEAIADMFIQRDVDKIEEILDELNEEWGILHDDLDILKKQKGVEVQIAETEQQIKELEDDIEKFEIDKELLLSGDLSDVISTD